MNGMTCTEFDEVMRGFVRMGLLHASVREAVIEHAAYCDRCLQWLSEVSALAEAVERVERPRVFGARSGGKA
jgi:hypothetical protein